MDEDGVQATNGWIGQSHFMKYRLDDCVVFRSCMNDSLRKKERRKEGKKEGKKERRKERMES